MALEAAEDQIGKKVELAWLAAFYAGMLTEGQRHVLELHCEEDLSLSEIAEETGTSRQAVHEQLTRAAQKLFSLEEKLGMAARFQHVQDGLEQVRQLLADHAYDEAAAGIDRLIGLEQEEHHGL